jgi:hypothetical protein
LALGSNIPFFYHYKIYDKNFGIRQFSSSIIKNKFWLRGSKFEPNPMGYIGIFVVRFETHMDHIRSLLTELDFLHGPKWTKDFLSSFLRYLNFQRCKQTPKYFMSLNPIYKKIKGQNQKSGSE